MFFNYLLLRTLINNIIIQWVDISAELGGAKIYFCW